MGEVTTDAITVAAALHNVVRAIEAQTVALGEVIEAIRAAGCSR